MIYFGLEQSGAIPGNGPVFRGAAFTASETKRY